MSSWKCKFKLPGDSISPSVSMTILKSQQQMLVCIPEKGTLLHHWWEDKLVEPQWKSMQSFLEDERLTCLSCDLTIARSPLEGLQVSLSKYSMKVPEHQCLLQFYPQQFLTYEANLENGAYILNQISFQHKEEQYFISIAMYMHE